MKPRVLSVLCALAVASLTASVAQAAPAGWKLVWSEEFDAPGLPNPARWTYETGFVRNAEKQFYTANRAENARVENGMLVIEARKEHFPNPRFDAAAAAKLATEPDAERRKARNANVTIPAAEYTAASVTTEGREAWKYARVEVRAKLPAGRGMWPAIWMLGENKPQVGWPACGEIDIMEFVGFAPDTIHANVHMPARTTAKLTEKEATARGMRATLKVPHPDQEFHVYSVEWDAEQMRFFVDDTCYLTYRNPHTDVKAWPFDQKFYLILNIAVGGAWGGQKGIDDAIFPQRMLIDYVRVYERAGKQS